MNKFKYIAQEPLQNDCTKYLAKPTTFNEFKKMLASAEQKEQRDIHGRLTLELSNE